MKESTINFELSDRDFALFLTSLRDPKGIIVLGKEWFERNGKPVSKGTEVVTIILNNARSVLENVPVADDADFNLDERSFAQYLRTLRNKNQIVVTGLAWFSYNGEGYGDALELTTTVFNNLRVD